MWLFLLSTFPLALLILLMTKPNPVPSQRALPLAAGVMYLAVLLFFGFDANLVNATVLAGLLTAWTPILIVWGAIFLFKTLENSGGMGLIRNWLDGITPNRIGQLMIIAWAFSFLIEGVSGFGTPAALAAPILVGLGFEPVGAALVCLVMNSVPISFGAVGTPLWFGLSQVTPPLTHAEWVEVGFKTGLIHSIAAFVIVPVALLLVQPRRAVWRSLPFIFLSVLFTVVPFLLLAPRNLEFPSMLGGAVGLIVTVFLARHHIGLPRTEEERGNRLKERGQCGTAAPGCAPSGVSFSPSGSTAEVGGAPPTHGALLRASFPIWGTVLVLLLTRMTPLNAYLKATAPAWTLHLGSLGDLSVSAGLVVGLHRIFGSAADWSHPLLYIPSIIPFFLVAAMSFVVYRMPRREVLRTCSETLHTLKKPILALSGTLIIAKLLVIGGDAVSPAGVIGSTIAHAVGRQWLFVSYYLGALGAFFAGSNTVSNLTFAGIQDNAARSVDLSRTTILALQAVGGAAGLMFAVNHVVAVCAVLGIHEKESHILKRTFLPMLLYGIVAGVVAWLVW